MALNSSLISEGTILMFELSKCKSYTSGSEYKPIMLILFDFNCDKDIHCSELRKEFKANAEIDNLSPYFHMVNLMGLQEHNQHFDDLVTNPWYLPRIFFLEDNVSMDIKQLNVKYIRAILSNGQVISYARMIKSTTTIMLQVCF